MQEQSHCKTYAREPKQCKKPTDYRMFNEDLKIKNDES